MNDANRQRATREGEERVDQYRRAVRVREALYEVLLAAGLSGLAPLIDEDNPLDKITLPALSAETGWVIAELLRSSLATEFGVAEMVRAAFKTNGVDVDVRVVDRRITLGGISVADGDLIAVVLGAPEKYSHLDFAEFDDVIIGLDVAARLDVVCSQVAGAYYGTDFLPGHSGGGGRAVILIGGLDITAARKIAMRLDPGVAW